MRPQRLEDLEAWTTAKHVARTLHEHLTPEASARYAMLVDRMRAAALDCLQHTARALPPARRGASYFPANDVDLAEGDALVLHTHIALACELGCLSREHAEALLQDVNVLERALHKLKRLVSLWEDELMGEQYGCRIERYEPAGEEEEP